MATRNEHGYAPILPLLLLALVLVVVGVAVYTWRHHSAPNSANDGTTPYLEMSVNN